MEIVIFDRYLIRGRTKPFEGLYGLKGLVGFCFGELHARRNLHDKPGSARCTQGGSSIMYISHAAIAPGTQAMPTATASATCEKKAPARVKLGIYAAKSGAAKQEDILISHDKLHSSRRWPSQPAGICNAQKCT